MRNLAVKKNETQSKNQTNSILLTKIQQKENGHLLLRFLLRPGISTNNERSPHATRAGEQQQQRDQSVDQKQRLSHVLYFAISLEIPWGRE